MSRILSLSGGAVLAIALAAIVGWPAVATVREAWRDFTNSENTLPATGSALDPTTGAQLLGDSSELPRSAALALESAKLVLETEAIALPAGLILAFLLFRTNTFGGKLLLAFTILAAFVPLPLHATAWLGSFGNLGRQQLFGWEPILRGRSGAAFVHAMATLPWVVLIAGIGLCAVEPELEESALLDCGPVRVLRKVTFRRALGAIAAAALAVAVLTAGDMTVTDLLAIRTYAEESYLQYAQGRGPGAAALVALPPLCVLGVLISLVGKSLSRLDPSRMASAFARARVWPLGPWRIPVGLLLLVLVGNALALPVYGLIWRAGRVGGKATIGHPPVWSLPGLLGTLRYSAGEIWQPLLWSLLRTAAAATAATILSLALGWAARRSRIWSMITLAVLCLTLAAPGPVAGMALVLAYRDVDWIYNSPLMIVMAETLRSLPYSILLLWPFLRSMPQDYFDAAAIDGLDRPRQFLRIVIPLSLRAAIAAWAIAFAIALGELPATNIATPPLKSGQAPISVVIWGLLHTGVESRLAGVALILLLVVAGAGLFAMTALRSLKVIERPAA